MQGDILDEKTGEKNIECLMQSIFLNCIYWYVFLFLIYIIIFTKENKKANIWTFLSSILKVVMKVLEINVRNVMNLIQFLTFLFHRFDNSIQCTKIEHVLIKLFGHQIVKIPVLDSPIPMDKWLVYHLPMVQHSSSKQPSQVENFVE